jgi:predicted porin
VNGFQAGVGITKNDKTAAGVDTNTDANSFALSYANGPLTVAASQTTIHAVLKTAGGAAAADVSGGLMGLLADTAGTAQAYDVKQKETAIGGTYDLGKAKLFANYLKTEASGSRAATAFTNKPERTAYELGFQAPVTGAVGVFAKYGAGKTNLTTAASISAATATKFDFSGYQLGATYAFSKRTNAYLIRGHATADLTSSADAKATATAVGIRHQF